MTTTANLGITHIAASQNQKEVTANAAFSALDAAITETLAVSVSAGNAALTQAQVRAAAVLAISGATTSGRTVTWPAVKRPFFATLDASSTKAVSIKRGAKAYPIYPGGALYLFSDGTADSLQRLGEFGPQRTVHWMRGTTSNGEIIARWQVQEDSVLLPDLLGWDVQADVAAAASTVFQVRKNGSQVGTITFAASGTVPTYATTSNAAVAFAAQDFIDIAAPATADTTLAGIFFHTLIMRG